MRYILKGFFLAMIQCIQLNHIISFDYLLFLVSCLSDFDQQYDLSMFCSSLINVSVQCKRERETVRVVVDFADED